MKCVPYSCDSQRKIPVVAMRSYIFTELERKRILEWMKTGERTDAVTKILSRMNRNRHALLADIRILIAAIRRFDAGY